MDKKALIVTNLAGFASFLYNDFDILQNMGYEIVYASNGNMFQWEDTRKEIEKRNIPFCQIDFDSKNPLGKQNFIAYKQIKKLIEENDFQLIHCHTSIAGFITKLAARKARKKGAKVIYTSHGFTFTSKSSKKTWLIYYTFEKIASVFCDAIVTINSEDCNNAKKMWCKNVYKINGVGVDTKRFHDVTVDKQSYRNSIGVDDDKLMVLAVGELSDRKNHQIIIKALSALENKDYYEYVICGGGVGNGSTGEMLKNMAKENGVNLKLLGFRHDIPEITKISDIGVLPSRREGLGLAGVQCLCAGVPVIGSDVQGIKDYVIDGVNGYLCDSENADEFAKAIAKLTDKSHRETLSKNCYESVKKFDKAVSYEQLEKIYKAVLS